MKKIFYIFAASMLLASCSIKQVEYSKRTVNVQGTGTVTVDADNATIVLSVITRAKDVATASDENAQIMNEVQNAVSRLGVSKELITTENFSVFQENIYDKGKTIPGDYKVTNQVRILVKNIQRVSDVIDVALKSGANNLSSIEYGITDNELPIKQARTLAIQQAQEAATLLAGSSGAKLGKVLKITEEKGFTPPKARIMHKAVMSENASLDMAATPISGGKSIISIVVDVVYELN